MIQMQRIDALELDARVSGMRLQKRLRDTLSSFWVDPIRRRVDGDQHASLPVKA
jgi:hypothetical protein